MVVDGVVAQATDSQGMQDAMDLIPALHPPLVEKMLPHKPLPDVSSTDRVLEFTATEPDVTARVAAYSAMRNDVDQCSAHSGTEALRHCGTQAFRHSGTQALMHSSTQALRHSAFRHSGTQALPGTRTLWHSGTQALGHSGTQELMH